MGSRCTASPGILLLAVVVLGLAAAPAPAHDVLPDLDQVAPSDISVRSEVIKGRRHFRLGFASASANVGNGPLTLHGYRRGSRRARCASTS